MIKLTGAKTSKTIIINHKDISVVEQRDDCSQVWLISDPENYIHVLETTEEIHTLIQKVKKENTK